MKLTIGALLFVAALAFSNRSSAATLPDSCGDDNTTFDVKAQKGLPVPAPPNPEYAQIVFIEKFEQFQGFCIGCQVTTRVGVDGKWAGANHGNSYFAYNVPPGQHHLCVDWQSELDSLRQKVGLVSLDAQPGRVYYYAINVTIREYASGTEKHLNLAALNEDEGKYLVKIFALAAATPSK